MFIIYAYLLLGIYPAPFTEVDAAAVDEADADTDAVEATDVLFVCVSKVTDLENTFFALVMGTGVVFFMGDSNDLNRYGGDVVDVSSLPFSTECGFLTELSCC